MKPTFQSNNPEWTRTYECDEYKCKAHPRSCFFCDHCSDIVYDYTHGPYMFGCMCMEASTEEGIEGKCKHFIEG